MSPAFRVLYAEDNPQDAELTLRHFAASAPDFELETVRTGEACLARLPGGAYDLLLVDHRLPDMDGLEILKTLGHAGIQVPVVLVTGAGDEELVVRALRMGAASFQPKVGGYLEQLPALLREVVAEHRRRRSQGRQAFASRRVLYVEHDRMDVDLTLRHFARSAPHFLVDVVGSGADALALLGREPGYDAALIDLRMPGMDGLELVGEARRRGLRLPPFIVVTGQGDDTAAIASLRLGATDYAIKRPGYLDQLVHLVEHAIDQDRLVRLNEQLQAELVERQRTEAALRESERRRSLAHEASRSGTWEWDLRSNENSWSEELWALYGLAQHGRAPSFDLWLESIHPDGRAAAQVVVAEAAARGEELNAEWQVLLPPGQERWLMSRGSPVRDEAGRVIRYHGIVVDITARKRAEREQARLQEQLLQAQKLESIGRLAGGVAHDFNNMLGVILGHAELAAGQVEPSAPLFADLLEIRKAAQRSADLTRQLLAFARKQAVAPRVLDLNATLDGMLNMLRRLIGERIQLTWRPAPDLWAVRVDPSQLDQILVNLCVNARDAIAGAGRVTIETANATLAEGARAGRDACAPGDYVRLTVSDDGAGMDEATLARLFEPFFTTKGLGQGTGLGLATSYGIVRQNGGVIDVRSEPGRGSTFTIHLPRHLGEAPPAAEGLASGAARGRETVLVVEDEPAVLRLTRRVLEGLGYTVLTAATPGEALRLARDHAGELHLLLTDMILPELSGRELAGRLVGAFPGLRCLYMSGFTGESASSQGAPDRAVHFLQKPFTKEELAAAVRAALAGP